MAQANQTEQATPRRRQKAREKGQVARSRDLIGAASGMAATFVLFSLMSSFPFAFRGFFHDCVESAVSGNLRMDALPPFLSHSGLFLGTAAALGLGWTVALASALAQGGLVCSHIAAAQRLSRQPRRQTAPTLLDYGAARTHQVAVPRRCGCLARGRLPAPRLVCADGAPRAFFPRHARVCRRPG